MGNSITELEVALQKAESDKAELAARLEESELSKRKEQIAREKANEIIAQAQSDRNTFDAELTGMVEGMVNSALGTGLVTKLAGVKIGTKIDWPTFGRAGNLSKADRQLLDIMLGRKAMTIATPADGGYMVPTELGTEVIDLVMGKAMVIPFFNQIAMPTDVFEPPTLTSDPDVEFLGEATSATAKKPVLSKATLTAKKLITYVPWSYELSEASVVPVIPMIKASISRAIGKAEERVAIWGDDTTTAASNIDKNVASKNPQLALNGLWYTIKGGTATWFVAYATDWATSLASLRAAMDVYGEDPEDLLVICPVYVYNKLTASANFATFDKAGPFAANLTGRLPNAGNITKYGFFYGIPVACSSAVYKSDASGVRLTTAASNDKYNALIVNTRHVLWGRRQNSLLIEMDRNIVDQVNMMVISERIAMSLPSLGTTGAYAGNYNGS